MAACSSTTNTAVSLAVDAGSPLAHRGRCAASSSSTTAHAAGTRSSAKASASAPARNAAQRKRQKTQEAHLPAKCKADRRSATAQTACERVLVLHRGQSAEADTLAVSDPSLHKLVEHLPPSVVVLLEVLGSAWRLQKLLKAYGGSSIRVPSVWAKRANHLRTILGTRALKKFMDMYGGTDVYIPSCANFVRRLRDTAILRDYALLAKSGSSLRHAVVRLSARYDLSERQIRTILNTIP